MLVITADYRFWAIFWILGGIVSGVAGLHPGTRLPKDGRNYAYGSVPIGIAGRIALVALSLLLLYGGLRAVIS